MTTGDAFTYTPLSSPGSLRLIAIPPGAYGAPLQCTISEHLLDDVPPYECLSYAWGPPDLLGGPSILVDGHAFPISRELELALRRLRREPPARRPPGSVPGSGCEPRDDSDEGRRRMWIDAVCINQSDVPERNAQVARMADIYRGASCVVAWIGEESEDSTVAIEFLKKMSRLLGSSDGHEAEGSGTDTTLDEELGASNGEHDEEGREEGGHEREENESQGSREGGRISTPAGPSSLTEDDDALGRGQDTTCLGTGIRSIFDLPSRLPRRAWDRLDWDTRWEWERRLDASKAWLAHPVSTWRSTRDMRKEIQAYDAERMENSKRIGHRLVGVPILHYDFSRRPYSRLFEPRFESSWGALDNLFARPWWSRTWVVQEVWNAERTIVMCGAATMRWSHLAKAMDYYEGWDDMGYYVKSTRRWESWDVLKRRYGLAIHIANKRLLGAKLSDLLWNMWDREATDPRDKVFAVFGLVSEGMRGSLPRVDYAKTIRQVYAEAAANIIQQENSLDILLAASGPSSRDGLPSWVPDWRRESNARRPALFINGARMNILLYFSGSTTAVFFHGHGYSASAESEPIVTFDEEIAALKVGGVVLDKISAVGRAWGSGADSSSIIQDARSTLEQSPTEGIRRQTADEELRCVLRAGSFFTWEDRETQVIENIMKQRRFFVTEKGILCIGPAQLRPGDVVAILSGCNFPMVLRAEGVSYTVLGEAYGM